MIEAPILVGKCRQETQQPVTALLQLPVQQGRIRRDVHRRQHLRPGAACTATWARVGLGVTCHCQRTRRKPACRETGLAITFVTGSPRKGPSSQYDGWMAEASNTVVPGIGARFDPLHAVGSANVLNGLAESAGDTGH